MHILQIHSQSLNLFIKFFQYPLVNSTRDVYDFLRVAYWLKVVVFYDDIRYYYWLFHNHNLLLDLIHVIIRLFIDRILVELSLYPFHILLLSLLFILTSSILWLIIKFTLLYHASRFLLARIQQRSILDTLILLNVDISSILLGFCCCWGCLNMLLIKAFMLGSLKRAIFTVCLITDGLKT